MDYGRTAKRMNVEMSVLVHHSLTHLRFHPLAEFVPNVAGNIGRIGVRCETCIENVCVNRTVPGLVLASEFIVFTSNSYNVLVAIRKRLLTL